MERRRVALDTFLLNSKYVKNFEEKHRAGKEQILELEYKKSTINGEIAKMQERREELKKKVPILELEQKKYAEQKNFKAAGMKKGEIKDINEELIHIKERLDTLMGEEYELEITFEELKNAQK